MAKLRVRHLFGVLGAGLLVWELLTFQEVDIHSPETPHRQIHRDISMTRDRVKQEKIQTTTASAKLFPPVIAKTEEEKKLILHESRPIEIAAVAVETTANAQNDNGDNVFLEKHKNSRIYSQNNFSASVTTSSNYLKLINTLHGELSLGYVPEEKKREQEDLIRSGYGLEPYITGRGEAAWIENGIVYRPWRKPDPSIVHTKFPNPYATEYESYIPFDEELFFEGRKPDPTYKIKRKIMLWYTKTRYTEPTEDLQPMQVCPDFPCYITTNKKYIESSSAMLFAAQTLENAPPKRRPDQIFILHSHETPYENKFFDRAWRKGFKQPGWKQAFNWTMTYRMDSDLIVPYGIVRRRPTPLLNKDYTGIVANKTRLVAWLVSNCKTSSQREEYVKELQRHIAVDVFGKCTGESNNKCPHQKDWECTRMISEKYKFYIGFENSFCPDYITEKLFHFLSMDTITVARGTDEYFQHVPREVYLNAADFPSPKALAERLLYLHNNEDAYIEMLKEKDKYVSYMEGFPVRNSNGYVRGMGYRLDSPAMCLACLRLWNLDKYAKSVNDSHKWFGLKVCRKARDLDFLRVEKEKVVEPVVKRVIPKY